MPTFTVTEQILTSHAKAIGDASLLLHGHLQSGNISAAKVAHARLCQMLTGTMAVASMLSGVELEKAVPNGGVKP